LAGMVKSVAAEMHTATRGQLGVPPPVVVNAQGAITCPQCGSAMTHRSLVKGRLPGAHFGAARAFRPVAVRDQSARRIQA
jgi:hypothetical protein